MLAKLKIALVLLVIGATSGVLIWGTNALTEDRIALNRERARLAVYFELYPDMDLEHSTFEDVFDSLVTLQLTAHDTNGNLLGYAFVGRHENAFGFVEVVVGIDRFADIVGVTISGTSNTPNYVQVIYDNNLLDAYKGVSIADLELTYDVKVGATSTYNSVKRIIDAAILLVAGDPIIEQYQLIFSETASYQVSYTYLIGDIRQEMSLFNEENQLIGYGYETLIDLPEGEFTIAFGVNLDETFAGVTVLNRNAPQTLIDAMEAFELYIGEHIETIELDLSGEIELILQQRANIAFAKALEDDETRELLNLFEGADYKGAEIIFDDDPFLTKATPVYDASNQILGFVYEASAEAYNYDDPFVPIVMQIVVASDGVIVSVTIISHGETPGVSDSAFNAIDLYFGLADLDDYDTDVYSGATFTGDAIFNAVSAAQAHTLSEVGE